MKDEQFNTLVDLINLVQTNLTTRMEGVKEELKAEFKSDMDGLRTELKLDIGDLRAEFKSDMDDLRTELKSDIGDLRKEFKTETKEIKKEQKSMRTEMQEMKEDIKDIKATIKEEALINKKQHAFMLDLIQKTYEKCERKHKEYDRILNIRQA